MYGLEDLFSNPDQTEFLIVTAPIEIAVRDSVCLLNDLTFKYPDMPIKVHNIFADQVLNTEGSDVDNLLNHLRNTHSGLITHVEQIIQSMPSHPKTTKVQYLDTEPHGVSGLKVLADALLK